MAKGNETFGTGSMVMLEADLDASPHTLRFFTDGWDCDGNLKEQALFVTGFPRMINFAVCSSSHTALHLAEGHVVLAG
jgi:hypothetical protein